MDRRLAELQSDIVKYKSRQLGFYSEDAECRWLSRVIVTARRSAWESAEDTEAAALILCAAQGSLLERFGQRAVDEATFAAPLFEHPPAAAVG